MLRKLGYDNVVTFSYGRPGNAAAAVSAQVAEDIGFPWLFLPYSNESWNDWYNSKSYREFEQFSGQLASLPCLQDWPAIALLLEAGKLPSDGVVVSGHGGFLVGGRSDIAIELYSAPHVNHDLLRTAILRCNYTLWPDRLAADPAGLVLRDRLDEQLRSISANSADICASVYETWDWMNRQAKFIINSISVYEFHHLRYWVPLCDAEYMRFWEAAPLELRIGKQWYKSVVDELHVRLTGHVPPQQKKRFVKRIKSGLIKYPFVRKLKNSLRIQKMTAEKAIKRDPLAWYGLVPETTFRALYSGKEGINSFLVAQALGITPIRHGGHIFSLNCESTRTSPIPPLSLRQ